MTDGHTLSTGQHSKLSTTAVLTDYPHKIWKCSPAKQKKAYSVQTMCKQATQQQT